MRPFLWFLVALPITFNWTNSTENVDGSPVSELSYNTLIWGTNPGNYPNTITPIPPTGSYTFDPGCGQIFGVMTVTDIEGDESGVSNEVMKDAGPCLRGPVQNFSLVGAFTPRAVSNMPLPVVLQVGASQPNAGLYTLTGCTAGSALVVFGRQSGSATRTYGISDDQGNTWVIDQIQDAGRQLFFAYTFDIGAGDIGITTTTTGSEQLTEWRVLEVSNIDEVDVAIAGNVTDAAASHDTFPGGEDLAANSINVIGFQADASTTVDLPSGYTQFDTDAGNDSRIAYRVNASPVSADTGTISLSSTSRDGPIMSMSLRETAAGGGLSIPPLLHSFAVQRAANY